MIPGISEARVRPCRKVGASFSVGCPRHQSFWAPIRLLPAYDGLAAKLEAEAASGPNPFDKHRRTALADHLDAYKQHLTAKNDDSEHVEQTYSAICKVIDGCEFKVFDDIQVSPVEKWISIQRERPDFGIRTANYYTKAVKAFLTWMVKDGRAPSNPLAHYAELNGKVDVRRKRRALSQEDFRRLVEAARKGKVFRRLSGPNRAMLYEVAAYTGLREGELASLTRTSFDLDADPPTVTVEADKSKHRDKDVLPIHPELAARLREWMPADGLLWPGSWHQRGSEMVKADLEAARAAWIDEAKPDERPERERSSRLTYKDEQERYFDFHALRGQFVSSLARAGVHPKVAQQLARHSTIELTMGSYTHLETADLAEALQALPTLDQPPKIGTKIGTTGDDNGGQNVSLPDKRGRGQYRGQETPNPLQNKGFSNACRDLSKRRARESNPQPVARHLISSQAANHSRTLRNSLRNIILRHALLVVKGHFLVSTRTIAPRGLQLAWRFFWGSKAESRDAGRESGDLEKIGRSGDGFFVRQAEKVVGTGGGSPGNLGRMSGSGWSAEDVRRVGGRVHRGGGLVHGRVAAGTRRRAELRGTVSLLSLLRAGGRTNSRRAARPRDRSR